MQGVLPVLHGDQAVTHQKVLVALVRDRLLEFVAVYFAGGGVRVLARAGVFAAVRDIFCRLVELREVLLAQFLIDFEEPVGVEAPVIEFFGRQRCVSGDHCLLAVVKPLVHVRHEVVAAALKSVDPQHLFGQIQPLRRVHGHLDQAVCADLVLLNCLFQISSRLRVGRPADLEQMAQGLFLASAAVI